MSFELMFWPGWWWGFIALSCSLAWWLRRRADRRIEREYQRYLAMKEARAALGRCTTRKERA